MKYSKLLINLVIVSALINLMWACGDNPIPKPRGYFRIDLPERNYRILDSIYPYKFEYPVYAKINQDPHAPDQPYWINVDFPKFRANVHLSYKPLNNNLAVYTEDAHALVMKHIPKASAIEEIRIDNEESNVHGIIYDIKGVGAASPYQFYITDSSRHFLRGALYFNALPNNDSLAPVIEFLKGDIMHLLETTTWK
jgi:gliding motility-associated lipoprotein GldD